MNNFEKNVEMLKFYMSKKILRTNLKKYIEMWVSML